jgi:hypothetical protein
MRSAFLVTHARRLISLGESRKEPLLFSRERTDLTSVIERFANGLFRSSAAPLSWVRLSKRMAGTLL